MYIFRMSSGALQEAPENFNPDQPDFAELEEVDEVLVISKVLVKQIRLVAKPKEERAAIRAELSTEDDAEPVTEAPDMEAASGKRGRGRPKSL